MAISKFLSDTYWGKFIGWGGLVEAKNNRFNNFTRIFVQFKFEKLTITDYFQKDASELQSSFGI